MTLRLDEPFSWGAKARPAAVLPVPHDGMAVPVKAATGLETYFNGTKPMLSSFNRSPQKMMREAQNLYKTHPWIYRAEQTVTSKVAGLPWHIEDENDDEVDDQTVSPLIQSIRTLLEKPQAAIPSADRQPGISTWHGLISVTSRHMGLCGVAYWFLDQAKAGLPLAIVYINPARVTVRSTSAGNLVGYSLDADDWGNGGTFVRPEHMLAFHLATPDWGEAHGLVQAAALKAQLVTAADVHALSVLGTGGRIAGLVSPKDGYIDDPDRFAQLERDFRNVNEAADSAKRMTILRGPVDFHQTAADPASLQLLDMSKAGKEDILAVWGIPPSQAGVPEARGLNSGESGKHEYEVLMTGPVHDRVVAISEVIQYDLLDRYVALGIHPELVIEEPSFDDDGPAYDIAAKARELPLTNNQRLALIGLDPLPEYGPDGEALGLAIVLPSTMTAWAQGAEEGSTPDNPFPNAPKPAPAPVAPPLPPMVNPVPPTPQLMPGPMVKAGFLGLRQALDKRMIPTIRNSVQAFLASQRSDIAARLRGASERQMNDEAYWFRGDFWDRALDKALRPHLAGIASTVTRRSAEILATGKAKTPAAVIAAIEEVDIDPFTAKVERYVLTQTGVRIGGINETTRQAVGSIIQAGLSESLTASEIADRIETMPAFDEARAEMVARTESQFAYNTAAITSFSEYGVSEVQAIDGDGDEVCAARNGQVFSIAEAEGIEDHPNGTLDWAPYFAKADPMIEVAKAMMEMAQRQPIVNVHSPDVHMDSPIVNVHPAAITVEPSTVQVDVHVPKQIPPTIEVKAGDVKVDVPNSFAITSMPDRVSRHVVKRDNKGLILESSEVESDG